MLSEVPLLNVAAYTRGFDRGDFAELARWKSVCRCWAAELEYVSRRITVGVPSGHGPDVFDPPSPNVVHTAVALSATKVVLANDHLGHVYELQTRARGKSEEPRDASNEFVMTALWHHGMGVINRIEQEKWDALDAAANAARKAEGRKIGPWEYNPGQWRGDADGVRGLTTHAPRGAVALNETCVAVMDVATEGGEFNEEVPDAERAYLLSVFEAVPIDAEVRYDRQRCSCMQPCMYLTIYASSSFMYSQLPSSVTPIPYLSTLPSLATLPSLPALPATPPVRDPWLHPAA